MIEVSNLRKSFGAHVAVCDVSFGVERGEVFGLLGPNGAGKTTTLNMITGFLRPDSGAVAVASERSKSQSIGLSPQSVALYDDLTGEENLRFFGSLYNLSGQKLRERVDWALRFAGLHDRRRDLVGKYSGGMKRRLNLATGLIHQPEILILDEPTVGVDPQSRNHIFDGIEQLKKDGLTVIYTTHYMEEAQRLCDRVAIMDAGKILALDTVPNLLKNHATASAIVGETLRPIEGEPPVEGFWEGTSFRISSTNPLKTLSDLQSAGIETVSLHIERPNLESVFLNLTGRTLRD
ncbi:MAG: ABC transporter ATP-binding protein [Armatimonadetes bacterium]|nr:ABC transporter ATP-binding protein [Armatimonadota bacterium]